MASTIKYLALYLFVNILISIILVIPTFIIYQYYIEYVQPLFGIYNSDTLENPWLLLFVFFIPSLVLSLWTFIAFNNYIQNKLHFKFMGFVSLVIFIAPSFYLVYGSIKNGI